VCNGDPDRDPGCAKPPDIDAAVLLLVGDDEIGCEVDNAMHVGVLGAADSLDGEVCRVGAPLRCRG